MRLGNSFFVRKVFPILVMTLFLVSCHRGNGSLVGRWVVEKVNMEFDEMTSTPEMVRQYGEMEKGNILVIDADSTFTFVSGGDTLKGRCSLQGAVLYCEGTCWGRYEGGRISTETMTPLGAVGVIYKKEEN